MTIEEAERIIDIAVSALSHESPCHLRPLSALKGHDEFQVSHAIKLHIAAEYLWSMREGESNDAFREVVRPFDGAPSYIHLNFVPDEDFDKLREAPLKSDDYYRILHEVWPCRIDPESRRPKDQRFANLETPMTFAEFCISVGANDREFWKKIYGRIGLKYNEHSPRANEIPPELGCT